MVLAVDYKENQNLLRSFLKQADLQLAVPMDLDGRVTERYLVQGFPTAFVIDERGVIRDKIVGSMTYDEIRARLDPLLPQ